MNIFRREMKAHRKALIGWSIGMIILVISGMAKFSALSGNAQTASEFMNAFPKAVLVIMGIQGFDLTTVIGYFGVLFIYIVLMATIHAAMIGSEIISKEERDRTSEFLFPKPVSRSRVVSEKLLAGLANVVVLNLVTLGSSIFMVAALAKDYSNTNVILVLLAALLLMQVLFFAVGAALAGLFKRSKLSSAAATAILLGTYIIWVVMGLNDKLEFLKYLTPFKYFDASVIVKTGGLDLFYVGLSLIVSVVLVTSTYITFNNRDLKV